MFPAVVQDLSLVNTYALDCETTGINPFQGDRLFAIVICTGTISYYFNFQEYPDLDPSLVLDASHLHKLKRVLEDPSKTFYCHNAKFDMAFLEKEGIELQGKIHCTMAVARILHNNHLSYTLKACVERIGLEKSEAVEEYIRKHRLWEWQEIPGKKTRFKRKFFGRVSFNAMSSYSHTDGKVTFALGQFQRTSIREDETRVYDNETRFTQVAYGIEKTGIRIDPIYCEKAAAHEQARAEEAVKTFEKLTQTKFLDSAKLFTKAFSAVAQSLPKTDKGNTSFDDEALKSLREDPAHWPIAEAILCHRDASKKLNSYYRNFLHFADSEGIVHPNIRQSGTATGRVSIVDPALQTVNKEEDKKAEYSVRKSFIPRDGYFFVEMDYKAMEFRMLIDYAGEGSLAKKILAGLDPHQATADLVRIDRRSAKTISFGLLYGMGVTKLGESLGITTEQARHLKNKYFSALPKVEYFISNVTRTAKERGFVFNWLGRRSYFPDPTFAYKAVNYLIQGGAADAVKAAMNRMHEFLQKKKSRMVLQIHDAVLFEISFSEIDIIPTLKRFMEEAYPPRKCLPMEVSVEYSLHSWGELTKYGEEARDHIQREGFKRSEVHAQYLGGKNSTSGDSGNTRYLGLHQGILCGT